ncbi:MAG: ABC transporter permease [Lachnospiraceae bacterium]|nr:ABC transporter permease [Lachnospiraceae bacterium]
MAKNRIFLSLLRRKTNWFMCLLLTVLTALIFTGVLIWQASLQSVKELEKTYGSSFKLVAFEDRSNPDFMEYKIFDESYSANVYIGPRVTLEMLDRVSEEVDGIINYEYRMSTKTHLFQEGFQLIPGSSDDDYKYYQKKRLSGTIPEDEWQTFYEKSYELCKHGRYETTGYGFNDSSYMDQFRNGSFRLVSGRHISPSDYHVAMITPTFAKSNNLRIGDTFPLMISPTNSATSFKRGVLGTINATIVGIFEPTYEQPVNSYTIERDIVNNWILFDLKTFSEMDKTAGWSGAKLGATIYVEDPSMTREIMEQVKNLDWLDKKYYGVEADDSSYHNAAAPIRTIRLLMAAGIAAAAIAGAALMYLALKHNMSRRNRETGILMALGVTGTSIRKQFFVENLILGSIAFFLALGIASAVAPSLGDSVLHTLSPQKEQRAYTDEEIESAINRRDYEALEKMQAVQNDGAKGPDSLNVRINPLSILITGLGMTLLIYLCVSEAMQKTLRLDPSKILSIIS